MDEDRSSPCFVCVELMSVPSSARQDITAICKCCDKTMDREDDGLGVTTDLCLIFTF